MRILYLEDSGDDTNKILDLLVSHGYQVDTAYSIYEARDFISKNTYDCLIIDINLSPDGLTIEQKKNIKGGVLTGWVWFQDEIMKKNNPLSEKAIIFSDYTEKLKSLVPPETLINVGIIRKQGSTSRAEVLLEKIEELVRKNN